eukprot:GHVL01045106.1.p1 GENE.GHVL01045106.1~~GHVL01045106.1.p1  ORF type:complete len:184 (-),score=62.14 GHVL01045106.1:50-601(-)
MKIAEQTKGGLKNQLLEQQKNTDSSSRCVPQFEKTDASVWNVNSYHWEEKPKTKWAISRLEEILGNLNLTLLNGTVKIETVGKPSITGEASKTIRKGKNLIICEMKIHFNWKGVLKSNDGSFLADSTGTVSIPEFSMEEYKMNIDADESHPARETINKAMRNEGKDKLEKIFESFMEEFSNIE